MIAAVSTPAARERPILFSAPMVKAILAGTKTQTRRLFFSTPGPCASGPTLYGRGFPKGLAAYEGDISDNGLPCAPSMVSGCLVDIPCPHGSVGDRLWVRETWAPWSEHIEERGEAEAIADAKRQVPWASIVYRADSNGGHVMVKRWRPSIFLPRWASRITLEITGVRCERLHDITEDDAKAEGMKRAHIGPTLTLTSKHGECANGSYRDGFQLGWDTINGKRAPWSNDPFVWVLSFRRLTQIGANA